MIGDFLVNEVGRAFGIEYSEPFIPRMAGGTLHGVIAYHAISSTFGGPRLCALKWNNHQVHFGVPRTN